VVQKAQNIGQNLPVIFVKLSDQFAEAFELLSKPPIAQLWLVPSCHSLLVKCRRISTTQESSHLTSKEPTGLAIII
jgi:hypothetical protein